jgi:hypothetical protein
MGSLCCDYKKPQLATTTYQFCIHQIQLKTLFAEAWNQATSHFLNRLTSYIGIA